MTPKAHDSRTAPRHPIRVVAERTGISPATLRAWERRHRAIAPRRSDGAQRLYSDADIERLRVIAELAADGYPLADLARQSTAALTRLARRQSPNAGDAIIAPGTSDAAGSGGALSAINALREFDAAPLIARLLADTRALNAPALRSALTQAIFELGPLGALDKVVSPFLAAVGDAWACDALGVAHEHLASAAVRDVIGWLLQNATYDRKAPAVVATTVAGELHEFGAMMSAAVAAIAGWRVIYLGPNVPADELVRVVNDVRPRVVAAGLVARNDETDVGHEMARLRRGVGARVPIVTGGAACDEHRLSLRHAGVEALASRAMFRDFLDSVWTKQH